MRKLLSKQGARQRKQLEQRPWGQEATVAEMAGESPRVQMYKA